MNMSLGKIELNSVSFEKDMGMDELLCNSKFHSYKNNDGHIDIFTAVQVNVEGYFFDIEITFLNKRIDTIELIPVNLGINDPGYPDKKYQEEKKKVADSFLRTNLGNPSEETETVLSYNFEWGSVTSVAYLSGRNKFTGGFVEVSYNN